MKAINATPLPQLQEGQLWKLKRRYICIVALLGSTIRFKLLDSPNEPGERILTSGVDTLLRYLHTRKSKLVAHFDSAKASTQLS